MLSVSRTYAELIREVQYLSSGNLKLKSQMQSVNSVLSEQGELLRKQTEQLEKYSGSDIIFQENERLKIRIAESEKQTKEMQDKAKVILFLKRIQWRLFQRGFVTDIGIFYG